MTSDHGANVIFPDFNRKRRVQTGLRTDLISNMLTDHMHKIGALKQNERFRVIFVDVDGPGTKVEGDIESLRSN